MPAFDHAAYGTTIRFGTRTLYNLILLHSEQTALLRHDGGREVKTGLSDSRDFASRVGSDFAWFVCYCPVRRRRM
jgi:hypothetical protein